MRSVTNSKHHSAQPMLPWCTLDVTPRAQRFVPATASTKICPVVASGGPFPGGSD